MNIFRSSGFDTIIGKGAVLQGARFELQPGTTMVEGKINFNVITNAAAKLMVNGSVQADEIVVDELVVNGDINARRIVAKTIAANKKAVITADEIVYEKPIFEPGAVVNGKLQHSSSLTAEPTQGA